jgi:hypothetical protein
MTTRRKGREGMIANAARQYDPIIAQLVEKAWDSGAAYERERSQGLIEAIEDYCYEAGGNDLDERKKKHCREVLEKYRSENETE